MGLDTHGFVMRRSPVAAGRKAVHLEKRSVIMVRGCAVPKGSVHGCAEELVGQHRAMACGINGDLGILSNLESATYRAVWILRGSSPTSGTILNSEKRTFPDWFSSCAVDVPWTACAGLPVFPASWHRRRAFLPGRSSAVSPGRPR